ncbi:MAG: FMN-binding negative transcriptional regulator [Haliscomenobacteraceae bacterium CHB4]|nr:Protease synthase and sporulation protein PAI 2 [Saprospiraceae bacterium]MCE7926599.1 FMN-binding negative transcriptional regulator [Haliscomenobacteraceae bacterium CHB4]
MYVPSHFSLADQPEIVAFMQRFNFATIVSVVEGLPYATHLPFVVEEEGDGKIRLLAHFAKANPQWKSLEEQTALVIFSEPHAYISPSLYSKEMNVPTWNYAAVHAYGRARLIQDAQEAFHLLEKQMHAFEHAYIAQWARLPQDYKDALVKGIAAFEIPVEKLEAKWKMSQNKPEQDRANVMRHLLESEDGAARQVGEMMREYYQK